MMTHISAQLFRLRAAIPSQSDEYHRTTIRLAIAEIEHHDRVETVRSVMYGARAHDTREDAS